MISKLTSALVAVSLFSACTTLGHKGSPDDDGLSAAKSAKAAVVIQVGQKNPTVAQHDRQYWLEQRQAKSVMPRLQGALATGEAEAAVGLAKARLAKAPGDVEALQMLAAALVLSRNYDLAAYYAGLVDKAQPGNAFALNVRGLAAMLSPKARMADYRQAQAYFQQAFQADQSQIAPGLNLGNLQLELGNAAGAAQTFADVVDRCGRCTPGLMGMGVAQLRGRDFKKAETAFQEVLGKNPSHAGALYNLALVYKNGYNDKQQAEKYLFALLNKSRTQNVALRERAQVVLRMLKGEATNEERTQIADDDAHDAELLMTGAGAEDKDED